jgi:hypothetical protein
MEVGYRMLAPSQKRAKRYAVKVEDFRDDARSAKDQEHLVRFEAAAVRREPELRRFQGSTGSPWG